MNYFAHAYPHLAGEMLDPYFLAGLAAPDWLAVVARRTKCRTRHVEPWMAQDDPNWAALARGIARHHADDRWFHETRIFTELSLRFARRVGRLFPDATGMRPGFLGHILVELLLDAELIARDPRRLERYYAAIALADPARVTQWIEQMSGGSAGELAEFMPKFVAVRFLADYADNQRLCYRVNQVLRRVRLAELPESFAELLPEMRLAVAENVQSLMDVAPASSGS